MPGPRPRCGPTKWFVSVWWNRTKLRRAGQTGKVPGGANKDVDQRGVEPLTSPVRENDKGDSDDDE
jgi:hypothetical protein